MNNYVTIYIKIYMHIYVSGHYKHQYFPFSLFFHVVYFSHKKSAPIKKLIEQKLMGALKNLGVGHFQGSVGRFGAP